MLTTIYVDAHATSATHNGVTWNTAYLDLQQALAVANSGDTIRVADGTYAPGSGTNTSITFQLKNSVTIQGGYAGFGAANPNARDIVANKTILTGILSKVGTTTYVAGHVVTGSGTNSTAILDGFTITEATYGGMYNSAGSPTVTNCTFYDNFGSNGGGMDNEFGSNPTISNCVFLYNHAINGGGLYNDSSAPTIQNCKFQENNAGSGGGIYNISTTGASSPIITNTLISRNFAGSSGGGIYSTQNSGFASSPTLTGCTLSWNRSNRSNGSGGGAYSSSSASRFVNCIFLHNTTQTNGLGGGLYVSGSIYATTLINCLFDGNTAANGGGAYSSSSLAGFTNCTFAANTVTGHGAAVYFSTNGATLTNCVAWGNTGPDTTALYPVGASVTVTYSDIQGGWTGTGNINLDPVYTNGPGPDGVAGDEDDDLRLRNSSPAADAGNDNAAALTGISTDLSGAARFTDIPTAPDTGAGTAPIIDMGAYEAIPGMQVDAFGPYLVATGQSIALKSFGYSDQPGSLSFAWDLDGDGQYDDATGPAPTFSSAGISTATMINIGVQITDSANHTLTDSAVLKVIPPVIYVDDSAPGANNGGSWSDAYRSLQTAMLDALPGCTIEVAQGTYKATPGTDWWTSFDLKSGVALVGGYAGYGAANPDARNVAAFPTILSGDIGAIGDDSDNTNQIVTVRNASSSTLIDGFTVTAGNAWGTQNNSSGAGISVFSGSPTIRNCSFIRNRADDNGGGGLVDNGGGTVSNCVFQGNLSSFGGAMDIGAIGVADTLNVTNCIFTGNMAFNGGAIAVSLSNNRHANIINCTINSNRAAYSRGAPGDGNGAAVYVYSGFSGPSLSNCIVLGNTVGQSLLPTSSPFYPSFSTTNCDVQSADPLFVKNASAGTDTLWGSADDDYGDVHLKTGSPCIDAGANFAVPNTLTLDLDGHNRLVDVAGVHDPGVIVDMGPYETTAALSSSVSLDLPSSGARLVATFNANVVGPTIETGDMTVTNLDTSQPVGGLIAAATTSNGFVFGATWTFGAPLPDGNYHATLAAGSITDPAGNAIPQNDLDFFIFAGDADHNRTVNTGDFTILASNFNKSGTFATGDFNFDGKVNALDFNVLATKFGTTLASAPLASQAVSPLAPVRADLFGSAPVRIDDVRIDDALSG